MLIYWYSFRISDDNIILLSLQFAYNVVQFILLLFALRSLRCFARLWRMPERRGRTQIGSLWEMQKYGPHLRIPLDCLHTNLLVPKKNGTNHRETQKYHELAWFFECMLLVLDSIILVFYLLGLCHSMKPDCCSGKWKRCSHPTRIFEELNWKRNSSWRWPHAKPRWNEGKAVGIVPQQTEIKKLVHPNINAM